MSPSKKRRKWSSTEKMRIVLVGVEISKLCRTEGISPTQFYTWEKQLIGGAEAVFGKGRGGKSVAADDPHEKEVARLRAVIAKVTAENLELKKRSRDRGPRPRFALESANEHSHSRPSNN